MPIEISLPGSKSITNRALLLAALAKGKTFIKNSALCDDSIYMINGLKKLGISIKQKRDVVEIFGCAGKFQRSAKTIKIFTGNAGTATRFLTALATLTDNTIIIDGDKRMRERPIKELVNALEQLGANIEDTKGCPPVKIFSSKLQGGKICLPGNISSQYISALLMCAPLANKKTIISISKKLYSKPYIEMTLKIMKSFGIKVKNKKFIQYEVPALPHYKSPKKYQIEGDASCASYIGAYAALHPEKKVLIKNLKPDSLQGDMKFLDYLKKMGCKVFQKSQGILIQGTENLKSLGAVDFNEIPDLVMTFAVLSMFTEGKTKITNIANLRIKETDRISALENELKKFGVKVKTGKDYIEIFANPKIRSSDAKHSRKKSLTNQNISIETYNDHRIAMSFGILKDIFPKLKIKNPSCVSKSYTNFWKDLNKLTKTS